MVTVKRENDWALTFLHTFYSKTLIRKKQSNISKIFLALKTELKTNKLHKNLGFFGKMESERFIAWRNSHIYE